ncbi:MAG: hypothetical protein HZB16_23520 [Armatimonadetes bacterium]|nr:hypothetical protein [Armatimonadota bacterium]
MRLNRRMQVVDGEPDVVASHVAVRLAHLGDEVEPVSATEFVWRPQTAERRLFGGPKSVRVRVLPDTAGQSAVVLEWRGGGRALSHWAAWALVSALGIACLNAVPGGWPWWKQIMALWPAVAGWDVTRFLRSGWLARLERQVGATSTEAFANAPTTDRWLTLDAEQRVVALGWLRQQASSGTADLMSVDRRSAVTLWGWPLWHVAAGPDRVTGRMREARGWYARGQFAMGLVAVGQVARGWLAVGQAASGLVAMGQLAVGYFAALGQAACSTLVAVGQAGIGLIGIGMVALGLWIVAGFPTTVDIPGWVAGLCAAVVPVLTVIGLAGAKMALSSAERRELEARLEAAGAGSAVADEASLSPAQRMAGDDAERGISQVDTQA